MKTIAALFDCDGTLYSAQYGRGLMKYAADRGHQGAVRAYYASLLPLIFMRKYKLIAEERFHRPLTSRMAWMVKGMTEHEFRDLSECMYREYLLPKERTEVVVRLHDHQSKGHAVLLVSAQLLPSLEVFGDHHQADGVVGTRLEVRDGRYTGSIIPPVITGAEKDRYTRHYFSSHDIEVDWEASYAYADSITDTGLLNMVGHPVAVHPDANLFELAQARNWEMIGEMKELNRK
jgi:HAD superfamily hydrolase (TIGR01490 family)